MTAELTPNTQITQENVGLLPCPFCGASLRIRQGVNAYSHCDTKGCHSNRAQTVPLDDPRQVAALNRRPALSPPAEGERPETDMEHMARDMRDGVFLSRSDRKLVPDRPAEWWLERARREPDVIISAGALCPPAEVPFAAEDACLACNSPTPAPVDHIGDATEKVDWARCQRCGGEIQGWICQDCHQEFEENDAGELVFCPSEGVDWERVGPKLVEAGYAFADHELASDWRTWSDERTRRLLGVGGRADAFIDFRAALAAAQPEVK